MLSKDAPPAKRAPRYPAVFLESFECMVEDESLVLGLRLVAWIKLVKLWASLRWDDVQRIVPKELRYYAGRMTTILRITKTTGPTKRVQELPVCVSEHSFVTSPFWLKTGFDLFKEHANFDRDYLLPKLNKEWSGFRRSMAMYNDITTYSTSVRKAAKRPGSRVPLVHSVLATFWTEHSERATLPTGLALLRVGREERDMLGRWKPDGSDTYIRMYNGVVSRLQHQYAKALRAQNRSELLDERDVVESASAWLSERCEQLDDDNLAQVLAHLEESLAWKVQPGWDMAGQVEDVDEPETEQSGPHPVVSSDQRPAVSKEERKPLYVVVNTGRRCKRLHKSQGGCWMGREMTFKSASEFFHLPDSSEYTHVCKVVFQAQRIKVVLDVQCFTIGFSCRVLAFFSLHFITWACHSISGDFMLEKATDVDQSLRDRDLSWPVVKRLAMRAGSLMKGELRVD
eukprot:s3690_g6.t1